jgi:Fe-S cluster assembly ATP-binding protein
MSFLSIKDLHVNIDDKEILNGVNLDVNKGEVHAIMGLNGSGKSTLANVLLGHPRYSVIKGDILVNDESILKLKTDERAKKDYFWDFNIRLKYQE